MEPLVLISNSISTAKILVFYEYFKDCKKYETCMHFLRIFQDLHWLAHQVRIFMG